MCYLSMKLFVNFDPNPMYTVDPFNFAAIKFSAFRVRNFRALKICFSPIVLICYNDEQTASRDVVIVLIT